MFHEAFTICSIGYNLYKNRNRICKFLRKYKIGRVILGIVLLPFFAFVFYTLYKMCQDPEFIKMLARVNAQKKISDYV